MLLAILLSALAVLLASAITWITIRWLRVKRYWAHRNVPHDPPNFILGSLTFLQKQNTGIWMRNMYFKFRRPYFGIWLFWRPALVINDPEIIRRVMSKDSDVFRNRFQSSGKSDPIGSLNIQTLNDPLWSEIRRQLTPVFTSVKLKTINKVVVSKGLELVQRIQNDLKANTPIELRRLYADYTMDIIGITSFGIKSDVTLTGDGVMKTMSNDIMTFSVFRGLSWCSIFFFPELVDIFGFSFYTKATTDKFRTIFRAMVEQRGGYEKEMEVNDFLDALLKMKRDGDKANKNYPEDLIIAQAVIFFHAGFDSTAAVIAIITYYIAYYPEVQEKLYNAFLEAKAKGEGEDSSALDDVTYCNSVIREVMRLVPPLGWFDRISTKDYKIDDNLTIPAGTPVYLNTNGTVMDPQYFPDPQKFDPERFQPENVGNIQPFTFLPFGEGPRICIGKRFAYQMLNRALGAVVMNFELKPKPGSKRPEDLQMETRGMFLMVEEKIYIEFVPRKKE